MQAAADLSRSTLRALTRCARQVCSLYWPASASAAAVPRADSCTGAVVLVVTKRGRCNLELQKTQTSVQRVKVAV